jgi:UDP-GlcNAc:undecaprenyl-phosphate GlcNAc-1-phosphate transferase
MKTLTAVQDLSLEVPPIALRDASPSGRHRAGMRMLGMKIWIYLPVSLLSAALLLPGVQPLFAAWGLRWVHILATSFGLSFSLTPLAAFLARRFDILDMPDQRKLHSQATPLLGGTAVIAGFVTALLANEMLTPELTALLAATLVLFGVGVIDDRRELPAKFKLLIQVACTVLVMAAGIELRVLPLDWGLAGRAGNLVLTLLWVVGITNAMNFFDGMDGLAAGLGAIIAFFLGAVAFQTDQPFLGWIAVAVLGGCLGFLPYNFRWRAPASVFMGDAGSTVIGFVLACVAVYGDWGEGRPLFSLLSPVLMFWVLIFDMVHITVDRILSGKIMSLRDWIDYVGKDHLHHRLADVLGCRRRSVLFIYLMGLCLGASAFLLRGAETAEAILVMLQASILVVLITVLERRGRSIAGGGASEPRRPLRAGGGAARAPLGIPDLSYLANDRLSLLRTDTMGARGGRHAEANGKGIL